MSKFPIFTSICSVPRDVVIASMSTTRSGRVSNCIRASPFAKTLDTSIQTTLWLR